LYAFKVLELNGQDLRREPWKARRNVLAKLMSDAKAGSDGDCLLATRHSPRKLAAALREAQESLARLTSPVGRPAPRDHH
jgi:ATP-dependent DNA ligase